MTIPNDVSTMSSFVLVAFRYILAIHWKKAQAVRKPSLSLQELLILEVIDGAGSATSREIGRYLGISASTMTEVTQRLHSNEQIGVIPNSGDGREKPWRLTATGFSNLNAHQRRLIDSPEDLMFGLDPAEKAELNRLLAKVAENQRRLFSDRFAPIAP